ncbi:MAG: hypothetical protein ACAH88_02715 [Roseimicrobium sp.]
MAGEKLLSGRMLMGCTFAVLFSATALILWVRPADSRAYDRLSKIKVGKCQWAGASPDVIYADLCARLVEKGEAHSVVVAKGIDLKGLTVTLSWDSEEMTAAEYAATLALLSGLELHNTPNQLVIDYEGKDHRTWIKKAQDWFGDLPKPRFEKQSSVPYPDPFRPSP